MVVTVFLVGHILFAQKDLVIPLVLNLLVDEEEVDMLLVKGVESCLRTVVLHSLLIPSNFTNRKAQRKDKLVIHDLEQLRKTTSQLKILLIVNRIDAFPSLSGKH